MNTSLTVLNAVVPVFGLAFVGFGVRKLNWLTEEADQSWMRVNINLLLPALILDSTLGNPALKQIHTVILAPVLGYLLAAAGMWLAFLFNMTALPMTGSLLPYSAREVYHIGQTGLGVLTACFSLGALLGSLTVSLVGYDWPAGRTMIVAAMVWYLVLEGFILMPDPAGGAIMLILTGFVQSFTMVPLAVMLLRVAGDQYRGRIMGVRMLAIYGLPVGLLASGVLIEWYGYVAMASGYCLFGLAATLTIALWWRDAIWRLDGQGNAK